MDKKIGFICPLSSWGGLEMNVLKLAKWLRDYRIEVVLFCYPGSELFIRGRENGFKVYGLESKSKFSDLLLVSRLAKHICDEGLETVILHTTKHMPLAVMSKIKSKRRFKLVYMQHMHLGGAKKNFYHKRLYNNFDSWIAPLPIFVEYLKENTFMDLTKVVVIPFGIELDRFTNNKLSKREAKRRLNLPEDSLVIGMVGRLDEKKCQHILIEAGAALRSSGHEIRIILAGEKTRGEGADYVEHLYQLTHKLGMNERVHFLDHIKSVEEVYAALDIFVLTTGAETFGMVTVEAMASGLPVIVSNAGGSKDIVTDDINGLLYEPEDVAGLIRCLESIIGDPQKAERLGKQASEDAVANYSHKIQCEKIVELLSEL